jgi:hypothetical protein
MFTDFYGDEAKIKKKKLKNRKNLKPDPRTNPWNFREFRIVGVENLSFFWVGHFDFCLFVSSPWKSVNICNVARMGQNFDYYPGLQQ